MLNFIKYTLKVVLEAIDKIRHYKYYELLKKRKGGMLKSKRINV